MCLKDLGLPPDTTSDDPRLQRLAPSFDERVRKGTKEIMIDDELRRRRFEKAAQWDCTDSCFIRAIRLQHAAEGEEMRKREEAAEERKRKAEEKDDWEKNRDSRINGKNYLPQWAHLLNQIPQIGVLFKKEAKARRRKATQISRHWAR